MPRGTLDEVEPYLRGLLYPATKEDAIQQARKNKADQMTLETLERLKEEKFYSHKDMVDALEETWKSG